MLVSGASQCIVTEYRLSTITMCLTLTAISAAEKHTLMSILDRKTVKFIREGAVTQKSSTGIHKNLMKSH